MKNHPGITSYPKRIVTVRVEDYGSSDGMMGSTSCPHCGARGRYVHYFLCDDGAIHAAMSGCIKLFPLAKRTPLAIMADAAFGKLEEIKRKPISSGKTGKLASWFNDVLEALNKLQSGDITLAEAENIASDAYNRREAWLYKNGYRKGRR